MEKIRFYIGLMAFVAGVLCSAATAQTSSAPSRTPEQEAARQTEKMQKELALTVEQVRAIYEINLKHARERKKSNKRADAVARVKLKNEEIGRVLSPQQNEAIHSKRTRIQSVEIGGQELHMRTDGVAWRQSSVDRHSAEHEPVKSGRPERASRGDGNVRQPLYNVPMSAFRPSETHHSARSNTTTDTRASRPQAAGRNHSGSGSSGTASRRESTPPPVSVTLRSGGTSSARKRSEETSRR